MSASIAWTDRVPPAPSARIWQPPEGQHLACILGDWRACWIHWMGKRSLPCLGDDCPAARHRRPALWYAYLPLCIPKLSGPVQGYKITGYEAVILACNREQAATIKPHLGDFPGPVVTVVRHKSDKTWKIEKIDRPDKLKVVTPCPDVSITLHCVWGMIPEQPTDRDSKPAVLPSSNGHTFTKEE